jgi:hypothetical protein
MRRRTKAENTSEGDAPFMDEDDQDEVVASLEQEGMKQIESTNRIFTFVCILAMIITALVVVIHGGGMRPCTHAVYSAGVHWLARIHATTVSSRSLQSSLQSSSVALLIFLVLSPLFVIAASMSSLNADDTATMHWSIALANLLVAICSLLLRIESANTIKAMELLEGSKYSYKSL